MARTKQTARKSVGRFAPRALLSTKRERDHDDSDRANEADEAGDIFDARLVEVTAALGEVERPGDCFTSGSQAQFAHPGIFCHLAPYGRGEATLVDTQVRNTWELHAEQFELRNAKWQRVIDDIASAIRVPLGMSETTEFDAKLYKLLLYETGGMFHTHQDSEKGSDERLPTLSHLQSRDALDDSLETYFAEAEDDAERAKRRRLHSIRPARVPRNSDGLRQREAQLVYMLEHKYTNPGLSFAYLKNKDHSVAQSLAKFCDAHGFSLYLCKVKYTYEYDPDDFDPDGVERSVQLKSPRVKYGDASRSVPCAQRMASSGSEIAPAGFFEEVPFDGFENHGYTGNAGSRVEKWYTSAALVVQPLAIELAQTVRAGMDYAVTKWISLVENESPYAASWAALLLAEPRRWSTTDLCFVPCLQAVRRCGDCELFGDVLRSLSRISFHEALAHTVDHFGWEIRVNLVGSVLHDCEDPVKIEELLTKVELQPKPSPPVTEVDYLFGSVEDPTETNPTGEEYARVLALAYRVSPENLREYVVASETKTLIKLVAPALMAFVTSSPLVAETKPEPIVTVVRSVIRELQTRMPRASNWDLSHIRLHGGRSCCQYCTELQLFLSSHTQQTLRRLMNKANRHHIHKVIEAHCGARVSHVTDRLSTLVMTKLLLAVDLHDVARDMIRSLRAWTGDESDETVDRTAAENEITEIDSD